MYGHILSPIYLHFYPPSWVESKVENLDILHVIYRWNYVRLFKIMLLNMYIFINVTSDLRQKLPEMGLVGFVGNGSCLPRKSPVDDLPLTKSDVSNFKRADALRSSSATCSFVDVWGQLCANSIFPLQSPNVVLFESPPELEIAINLPNHGVGKCMLCLQAPSLRFSSSYRLVDAQNEAFISGSFIVTPSGG